METIIDLNLISTFVRVVEAGSFTGAAHALALPTSSVSRRLTALEATLAVRLIQRSTRRLVLTEAGRQYFERARASLAGLADATAAVSDMSDQVVGLIRFTSAPDHSGVLAGFLAEFLRRYPKVRIEAILTSRRLDLVAEGVDLALRGGRLADSSLVVRRIGNADLGLYATAAYLRREGTPRTPADLARHRFVLLGPPDVRETLRLTGPNGDESIKIGGPLIVDDLAFGTDAVAAGVGIGLVPALFCELPDGRRRPTPRTALVRVLPAYRATGAELNLVSPPTAYEPTRVSLLRDFLAERYGALAKTCQRQPARSAAPTAAAALSRRRVPATL
jgi:DNA-binding transcriptional LysR family regulator